jgi:hypothetical protein
MTSNHPYGKANQLYGRVDPLGDGYTCDLLMALDRAYPDDSEYIKAGIKLCIALNLVSNTDAELINAWEEMNSFEDILNLLNELDI